MSLNRAVEEKTWGKIREILTFQTEPFPTAGAGHVLLNGGQ